MYTQVLEGPCPELLPTEEVVDLDPTLPERLLLVLLGMVKADLSRTLADLDSDSSTVLTLTEDTMVAAL